MEKNKFGKYVKEKRLERGLTQKELADLLMVDFTAVSKWERGVTYPDITLLPDLCKHLQVNEHELIESSNDTEYRRIKSEAQKYGRLKNGVFYSLAASYFVAVLTCFIVNLAVNKRLDWFFIVLTACACGFTFMPTVTRFFKRYKLTVFVGTTFVSLCLLYLACSLYTRTMWVWMGITGTLLFYFLVFWPVLFVRQKAFLHEEKYKAISRFFLITYGVGLLLLTVLLIACVAAFVGGGFMLSLKIVGYCFTILLAMGLVALLPVSGLCKAGLDCLLFGGYFSGMNYVLNKLLGEGDGADWYRVNFADWTNCTNGNVWLLTLGACAVVGVALLLAAAIRKQVKK